MDQGLNKIVNDFIILNYNNIIKMSSKIVKNKDALEVAHYVIEQFMTNKKAVELIEKDEAMRYLSGMIYNSYHSASSPFIRLHKPYIDGREIYKEDITDYKESLVYKEDEYDYEKDIMIEKIEKILNGKYDVETWFNLTLLKLYIETPNFVKLSKQVNIPRTSISIAVKQGINFVKDELKK